MEVEAFRETEQSTISQQAGGGATHIARTTGVLANLSGNIEDILIVAGGGGGGRNQANHVPAARWGSGGSGGGFIGGGARTNAGTFTNQAGTQTKGFTFGKGQNAIGNGAGRRRTIWRIFR